jgi:hypothetical protein
MKYPMPGLAALLLAALLPGCGGGGDSAPAPAPTPSPPPPSKVELAAGNYQDAVRRTVAISNSAYTYAKFGIQITDDLLNVPLGAFPLFRCPDSGTLSIELSDQNQDTSLDPGDTARLQWDHCKANGVTTTGLVRIDLTAATQIPGGRDYMFVVTVPDLQMVSDAPGASPITVNFIATVHYTRTATSDHTVIESGAFKSGQLSDDTGTSELQVDYLQDHAAQSYSYAIRGSVISSALGGIVDFTTPVPFTGVIGEFPSAGQLSVTGNANSSARLSEEGAAANDNTAVLVAVDTNGDGVAEASDELLPWNTLVAQQFFAAFADQVGISVPIP